MLTRLVNFNKRSFHQLSEQEILALAISNEEDDSRIYQTFAENLRDSTGSINVILGKVGCVGSACLRCTPRRLRYFIVADNINQRV